MYRPWLINLFEPLVCIKDELRRLNLNWQHPRVVEWALNNGFEVQPQHGSYGYPSDAIKALANDIPTWSLDVVSMLDTVYLGDNRLDKAVPRVKPTYERREVRRAS
jgi:hypothetical protein